MKKKIALVTGGYSGENVISYRTANTIYNYLDKHLFDVYTIDITAAGWFYQDGEQKLEVDKNDFSIQTAGGKVHFDCVFIGMHGTPGEDGRLQGYFDMLKLPYTSCSAAVSSLTFNKRYTTAVAGMSGIRVADSVLLIKDQPVHLEVVKKALAFPVFVKPNNGGSSIGMSKVNSPDDDLQAAIDKAFAEDDQVLVESMIQGREFTVGVFKTKDGVQVLPITEVSSQKEFFDFEAKYQGKSTETTPADISPQWQEKLESTARKVYTVFNCKGVVRIDFIFNEVENEPYMLEINTVPGQTEASVIPQQVRAKGWDLTDFYSQIVLAALEIS